MKLGSPDRDRWLALGSGDYLADGYLDSSGGTRRVVLGDYATAAAYRLLDAEVSPQELALTIEGIVQLLPMHEGPRDEAISGAFEESLIVVARATRQPNNGGLVEWLNYCIESVDSPASLQAFLDHVQAVVRLYALLVAALPRDWPALAS